MKKHKKYSLFVSSIVIFYVSMTILSTAFLVDSIQDGNSTRILSNVSNIVFDLIFLYIFCSIEKTRKETREIREEAIKNLNESLEILDNVKNIKPDVPFVNLK